LFRDPVGELAIGRPICPSLSFGVSVFSTAFELRGVDLPGFFMHGKTFFGGFWFKMFYY
jgi:hypothetical protein